MPEDMLEANELYHDYEAWHYDETQPYIRNEFAQRMFLDDITEILEALSGVSTPLKVLDCGAGTGNLTLKFLARGCDVTATDISEKMLGRLKQKAGRANGQALRIVHSDIDTLLDTIPERFHVVCSSSFLHHLPDYRATYRRMCAVCATDAVIYTAFEPFAPPRWSRPQRLLSRVDEVLNYIGERRLYRPAILAGAVLRRLKLTPPAPADPVNAIDPSLIERVDLGVDMEVLSAIAREAGFQYIRPRRRPIKRFRLTQLIDEHLVHSDNGQFLIAHRSTSAPAARG